MFTTSLDRLALVLLLLGASCSGGGADPSAAADAAAQPAPEEAGFSRETLLKMMSPREVDAIEGARGVVVREPEALDGVTLIAPLNSTKAHLVDLDGEVVHTWETNYAPGAWAYLMDDGTLLCGARDDDDPRFRGGGIGGILLRLAPDGTVLWRYELANDERHLHHDIEPMPNGNILAILWERKSADEAIARGRNPQGVGAVGIWPDAVYELEPTGAEGARVVWEWHAWDHLVQDVDPDKPNYGALADHPGRIDVNAGFTPRDEISEAERKEREERERQMAAMGYAGGADDDDDGVERGAGAPGGPHGPSPADGNPYDKSGDWLHTNSVAYHPELDLIVMSSPELSEIYVIDHSTTTAEAASSSGGRYGKGGDLLWRWGNPMKHGAGGEADRKLFYQHDPTWLGGADDLRLLVYNNGGRRQDGRSFSEVYELELPFDASTGFAIPPGKAHGPAEPAWSYADPERFFSAFISGAQRLPNGNTLICSGAGGHVFEVTADGKVVWDFYSTLGGDVAPPDHAGKAPPLALFRATRIPADHPGLRAILE